MNNFYVYVYCDQRKPGFWQFEDFVFLYEPFYVGKGKKHRIKQHLNRYMLNQKSLKASIIKSIISQCGELPLHSKIAENLTEERAIELEKDMIRHFGRKDNNTGILANHTDGGDGQSGCCVPHIRARKKVYQYALNGDFIKEWDSVTSVQLELNVSSGNIATAIKRGGSFCNSQWSYDFKERMEPIIKYQMPIKYKNIQRHCPKSGEIMVFETALDAEQKMNLRSGARSKILECAKGRIPTYLGYNWSYET